MSATGVAPGAAQCGAALLRIHLPILLLLLLLNGLLEAAKVSSDSSRTSTNSVFNYELLNAETSFFLKHTNEDVEIDPTTLQVHVQPFFVFSTSMQPIFNVTYGPFSTWKPVPMSIQGLRNPSQQQSLSDLNSNWKLKSFLTENIIFSNRPIIQVLFCLLGRDWDKHSASEKMPCVDLHVFFGAQELRTSCQLKGKLGMCLGEIDLPSSWFLPDDMTSNGDSPESLPVDLYYALRSPEESGNCAPAGSQGLTYVHVLGKEETRTDLQWVGSVQLLQPPKSPPRHEVRLDDNVVIYLPARSIRHGEIIRIPVGLLKNSSVEHFALRVKGKKGVNLLEIHPSNPEVWAVNKEINSGAKHTTILVEVSKMPSPPAASASGETSSTEVLQLEFELENITSQTVTRRILWHVAYDGQSAPSEHERITSELTVSQHDIVGLVAIAPAEELLNTAVLTGRTVALPLRVLVVEESGLVTDVSEEAQCYSLDEDVLKVSAGCEYAYVNGKERQGSTRARVHVSYEHMRASLDLTVWMPKLPLQIQISDTILNPIKNWRVPNIGKRGPILETVEDDNEPKGRGCFLQSQHAQLRVWAQFCAANPDKLGQLTTMLGPDWTADVTPLVLDHMAVEDTNIAQLHEGKVLIGREPGTTAIQVLSPLSDSILGERAVTVSEEKVSVSGLHVTLLSGLSLSLRPSSSEPSVVVARTTGLSIFTASKQEAILMIWLQYSDDTVVPLDVFSPREYLLTVSSLDQKVVSVTVPEGDAWPQIVAEGQGEGGLIRLELMICEACQKTRRRTTVVAAVADVHVRFSRPEESGYSGNEQSTESTKEGGDIIDEGSVTLKDILPNGLGTTTEAGVGVKSTAGTNKNQIMIVPIGMDISRPSADTNIPTATDSDRVDEELQAQNTPGLSDLQIGMYVLLSVFCLAILVFLINCIVFTVRYKRKQSPQSQDEILTHSHEWIELTNPNADTAVQPQDSSAAVPKQGSCLVREGRRGRGVLKDKVSTASTSGGGGGGGGGTGRGRLQGRMRRQERQSDRMLVKGEPAVSSPTTQRKRVTFTTFMTVHSPVHGAEAYSSLPPSKEREIEWICLDTGYREPENLRNYIQSLTDTL